MGDPLGYVQYRPAAVTNSTTLSTAFVDVDATNLAVTFEAPPSGTVDVVLHGVSYTDLTGVGVYWGMRDGSGLVPGTDGLITSLVSAIRSTLRARVTGLTPGAGYSWTWAHRTSDGAHYARLAAGGIAGGASITIEAAENTVTTVVLTDLDFYPGMRVALKLRTLDWADPTGFAVYAYGPDFVFSLTDAVYDDVVAEFAATSEGPISWFLDNRSIADPSPTTFELYANDSTLTNNDDGGLSPVEVDGIVCVHMGDDLLVWRSHFDAPVFLEPGDSILLDWRPNVTG